MQEIIADFCKEKNNGLMLLELPTGMAKTYEFMRFIAQNYDKKEYQDNIFIIVTALKKNLSQDTLKEMFKQRGREAEFEEISLFLDANFQEVVNKILEVQNIPVEITQTKEYQELKRKVGYLKELELDGEMAGEFRKSIYCELEPNFRNIVVKYLDKFKTRAEKIKAIKTYKNCNWIKELYPATLTCEKRILFMSMDKFILGNTTLIEPSYKFYNHESIKKAIIFIDEFDSTKQRILDCLTRNNVKLEIIDVFKRILNTLNQQTFPRELLQDSNNRQERLAKKEDLFEIKDIIEKLHNKYNELAEEFSLKYYFKLNNVQKQRNFLFHDEMFFTLTKEKYVKIKTDSQEKQNSIEFSEKKDDDGLDMFKMLRRMHGLLNMFKITTVRLAQNYQELQNEKREKADDYFTFEAAFESVLRLFNLKAEEIKFFMNDTYFKSRKPKYLKDVADCTIYNKGYCYYEFIDSSQNNLQTNIQMFSLSQTPEKILLNIAKNARVIGVSATASVQSVLGNYDLDYLKFKLGDDFWKPQYKHQERLKEIYNQKISGYDKVKINVEIIPKVPLLTKIFSPQNAELYENKLNQVFLQLDYQKNVFLKMLFVVNEVLKKQEVKSFLCLRNKLIKGEELNLLLEMTEALIKEQDLNLRDFVVVLNSTDYANKLADIKERLARGEKICVLSSYATLGAGQNIQYDVPEDVEIIAVNRERSNQKDFDGIYLENPTNLIMNFSKKDYFKQKPEELRSFIYQVESLKQVGELSRKQAKQLIELALRSYGGLSWEKNCNTREIYEIRAIKNNGLKTLKQAVGRICRTGLKAPNIYVYCDEIIFEKLDFKNELNQLLNPEYRAIVEKALSLGVEVKKMGSQEIYENKAGLRAIQNQQIFRDIVRNFTPERRAEWIRARYDVLRYPTIDEKKLKEHEYINWLFFEANQKLNRYSYVQEYDFGEVKVAFNDKLPYKFAEETVFLPQILEIPGIKQYFVEQGFATSFEPQKYLLTATAFNNFYKGALGEMLGVYLLKQQLGLKLKTLPLEKFELFDYFIEPDIYFDFKLWRNSYQDADLMKEKIYNKLEKCNGKKAFIINIFDSKLHKLQQDNGGKIIEIPALYDIDEKKIVTSAFTKIAMGIGDEIDDITSN